MIIRKKIKQLKYWEQVRHIFSVTARAKVYRFKMTFEHKDGKDEESHIECIAEKYGYHIVEEHILPNSTTYEFEKPKELKK